MNEQESVEGFTWPQYSKTGDRRGGGEHKENSSVDFFLLLRETRSQSHRNLSLAWAPAKCQIDQVLAGIVCCRVSAPVHSSKCWDPSDSFKGSLFFFFFKLGLLFAAQAYPDLPGWERLVLYTHSCHSPLFPRNVNHRRETPRLHVFLFIFLVAVQVQLRVRRWSTLTSYSERKWTLTWTRTMRFSFLLVWTKEIIR